MAVEIRTGVVFTGSREGDAARRELPTIYGYERHVVLTNSDGAVLVNDEGDAYAYKLPGEWTE